METPRHFMISKALAEIMIMLGISLNMYTLILKLKSNIRGHGDSGIPAIPDFLYLWAVVFSCEPLFIHIGSGIVGSILSRMLVALMLICFALLCEYFVPVWHRRWLDKKRQK
jgi:hypothetical protein